MGVELPKLPPKGVARGNPVGAVVRLTPQPPRPAPPVHVPGFVLSRAQRTLVVVVTCVAVVAGWNLTAFLPLRLLVVTFHELGHAAVAVITGGQVLALGVGLDESGFTLTRGGDHLLILNGGYLGSILTGLGLLLSVRTMAGARGAAGVLGAVLALVAVRFYTVDPVGLAIVLVTAVCLLGLATRSPGWLAEIAVRCLGWFSLLYALIDIRDDVFRPGGPDIRSDAAALEAITGVAAPIWGLGWVGLGVGLLWLLRRRLG